MAGVALSFRLRGEDRVALTWIGDGATSTGAFHEGFNLAAVQRAPLVVIVENNCYAYSTPVSKQTAANRSWTRRRATACTATAATATTSSPCYEMTSARWRARARGPRRRAARSHDVPAQGARGARRAAVRAAGRAGGVGGARSGGPLRAARAGEGWLKPEELEAVRRASRARSTRRGRRPRRRRCRSRRRRWPSRVRRRCAPRALDPLQNPPTRTRPDAWRPRPQR
jgi:hypothetical protein